MTCPTSSSSEALARPRAALDRRGFTLLELMLVMAVMSLALGLGLPRIGAVRTAYLAGEEAREVAAFVRAATSPSNRTPSRRLWIPVSSYSPRHRRYARRKRNRSVTRLCLRNH